MKGRFLITTALEDTWYEDNRPVLFLGEWCKLYSNKHHWMKLDAEVVPYHWDDREKLHKDYKYLRDLFERLLVEMTGELNNIHGVNHSLRYWRILIGPWLMVFISIIYDRWECIKAAITSYSIVDTKGYDCLDLNSIPQSMEHFSNLGKSDVWNHAIYSSILKFVDFEKFSYLKSTDKVVSELKFSVLPQRNMVSKIKRLASNFSSFFSQNNNYFFIQPYLSVIDTLRLQLKLHQFPVLFQCSNTFDIAPCAEYRELEIPSFEANNEFEQYAKRIVPFQLPLIYLEGYEKLNFIANNNGWPTKPKLIWTSSSYYMDDVFKAWSGEKVDEGVPLVIGQHGGHYGQGLFSFTEYHELSICDYYLSWGWKTNEHKVIPVGSVKRSIEKKRKRHSQNTLLFLISGTSRYSDGIASIPISRQWIDYMDDQIAFYGNLPSHITDETIIRLYPCDYGWSQLDRWKDKYPLSNIDDGGVSFNTQLLIAKLVVSGWNSTTYLESMLSNIPTIIFWDDKYFEIREEARAIFNRLRKVGILHDNSVSAANHIKSIWNEIDVWWARPDVVSAKNDFIEKYAYAPNILNRLNSVFRNIANKKS